MGALDQLIAGGASPAAPASSGSALDALIQRGPTPPSAPAAPVPSPTGATPPSPQNQQNPTPAAGEGSGYGAAASTDQYSGKPNLTYPLTIPKTFMSPQTTAELVDKTRVASGFDPTKPQPIDHTILTNGRMPQSVSSQIRSQLGATAFQELDHIMPLELGGSNDTSNLRLEEAANPNQKYNPSSNPTPTDPIENQIADKVRSGQISLLDGWREMAKAKGITLPEDKALNNPINDFLLNTPSLLKPLAAVQDFLNGLVHPRQVDLSATGIPALGAKPQPTEPTVKINIPFVKNPITISNQLGPAGAPRGGEVLKGIVELPERVYNDIRDTASILMGNRNVSEMANERVPSAYGEMPATFNAAKDAGLSDTQASIAAMLQGWGSGTLDISFAGDLLSGTSNAIVKATKTDLDTISAWKTLGEPSTLEEAKASQKSLAHEFHPDKPGGSNEAMAHINNAYDTLSQNGIPSNVKMTLNKIFSTFSQPLGRAADIIDGVVKHAGLLPSGEPTPSEPSALDQLASASSREISVNPSMPEETPPALDASGKNTQEPSLRMNTETLPEESRSMRYTYPSFSTNLDEASAMHSDYSTISKAAEESKPVLEQHLNDIAKEIPGATVTPPRVKGQTRFIEKQAELGRDGRPANDISDVIGGRIQVPASYDSVQQAVQLVKQNFTITKEKDFFARPNETAAGNGWGYRGVNLQVTLPNGLKGEIQVHTEHSDPDLNGQHKIFEKWRGKQGALSPDEEAAREVDREKSIEIGRQAHLDTTSIQRPLAPTVTDALQKMNDAREALRPSVTLTSGVNPGLDKFLTEDVKPNLAGLGQGFITAVKDMVQVLAPRVGANPKALDLIYEALGGRNKAEFIIEKTTEKIEKVFDKMVQEKQIDFIDRIKRGLPQETPELQAVADFLRELDTATYKQVREYKPTAAWKENHFRVLWKTIPGKPEARGFSGLFKRPFEGTKGFLKHATLVDMSEGIAKGGVPYTYNPIAMARNAYADQMKFITARRMFEAAKKQGLAKYLKFGKPMPEGFTRLNDKIARVYMPVEISQPYEGRGVIQKGEWVFEKTFARLMNNHLSTDYIRTSTIGKGFMAVKNATTAVELGLSAFHAVFETLETASSQIGLGIRKIVNVGLRGDMGMLMSGIKDILTAPISPGKVAITGSRAKQFLVNRDQFMATAKGAAFLKQFPDAEHLINDLFLGGGKLAINQDYKIDTVHTFVQNLSNGNYIGAALRMLPAANAQLYKPLFEHYIPNLKIGMFLNEYSYSLIERQAELQAGKLTRAKLARDVWDFVENRLGEMNFQNLFWNNTFKSSMQLLFRSVTWKLGNIRAFGGGAVNQTKEIVDAIRERRAPRLTQEMAWAVSLSILTATMAAIIMRAFTGKNPSSIKDLVYPQIDPNDETKRLSMPTYVRDGFSLIHSPSGYVQSSMSSEIGRMMDVWQNKDFYGTEVYNSSDPFSKQALDVTLHMIPLPFSVANVTQPGPAGAKAAGFLGFTQAPAYIRNSATQQAISALYQKRFSGGTISQATAAADNEKAQIRQLYYAGDMTGANNLLQDAISKGYITAKGADTFIRDADKPGDVRAFMRFDAADQETLLRDMSLDDLKRYAWEVKPAVKTDFSSLSAAARQFVDLVNSGQLQPPIWKQGRIQNQ